MKRFTYDGHHGLSLVHDFMVPKTQYYMESMLFEPCAALLVVAHPFHMLPAIHLDHKPRFETDEIDDIASQWMLTAKPISTDLPLAKPPPKPLFGIAHRGSQRARTLFGHRMDSSHITHGTSLPPS